MDKRDEELLKEIRPERHTAAMITLENLKYIKRECKRNKRCETCKLGTKDSKKGLCNLIPEDWDEYEITERMYE